MGFLKTLEMPSSVIRQSLLMFDLVLTIPNTGHLKCIRTKNTNIIYVKNVTLYDFNEVCTTLIGRRPQPLLWGGTWSVSVKIIITGLYQLLNKLLCKFL